MKYILGSGLIGLLARHILGPGYKLIPFKKSRYFSHSISLSDNEIIYDEKIEHIINDLNLPPDHKYFPISISYGGQLIFNRQVWSQLIVDKMYGLDQHPHAKQLLASDVSAFNITAKELHDSLFDLYQNDIANNLHLNVSSISNGKIVFDNNTSEEYETIINTIPMGALLKLLNINQELKTADYYVFLVATDSFDLEGSKRCFIADTIIPFWKVNILAGHVYQFFANGKVDNSDQTFSMMTRNKFRVLSSSLIQDAFPMGQPPYQLYNTLDQLKIKCVGSNAAHDYFIDVSTSIAQLSGIKR